MAERTRSVKDGVTRAGPRSTRGGRPGPWMLLVRLLAVGLAWHLAAVPAPGHARLVRAEPAPNAVLTRPPRVVRAWFSEELAPQGSVMNVRDARGRLLASGGVDLADLERTSMVAVLRTPLSPGTYTVGWRTVSAVDGDVLHGTFRFTVRR